MNLRRLERDEVQWIWRIDRSEVHHHVYRVQNGEMVLTPCYFDIQGWRRTHGDAQKLDDCFERGGAFIACFDSDRIIGAAVVDSVLFGDNGDAIELKKLYVSRDYRKQGVGARLFAEAVATAKERGAKSLYISATPTENTVNFYLARGCRLAKPPDAERLAMEPEDIHLLYAL